MYRYAIFTVFVILWSDTIKLCSSSRMDHIIRGYTTQALNFKNGYGEWYHQPSAWWRCFQTSL